MKERLRKIGGAILFLVVLGCIVFSPFILPYAIMGTLYVFSPESYQAIVEE
jgi:hypothetical protein